MDETFMLKYFLLSQECKFWPYICQSLNHKIKKGHKGQNTLKLLYSAYQPNKQLLSLIVWPKPPAQVETKSKF
jgi:hypothetical protein